MPAVPSSIVERPPAQKVGEETGRPSHGAPRNSPRTAPSKVSRERLFAGGVQKGPVKVEVRSNRAPHGSPTSTNLHERTASQRGETSRILTRARGGSIHAPPGTMVLPPGQGLSKIPRDEEPDFSGCESVVAQFLIVVQARHDGLGRTTRIGIYKLADFVGQAFKTCLFLTSLSCWLRHKPTKRREPLSKIRWGFTQT